MADDDQAPAAPARRRENTRERLIEAAFEVFAEQGVSAASVEAIVERAGFTRGAFYSNFESKVELFFAIADERYAASAEGLAAGVDDIFADALPEGAPITAKAVEGVVARVLALAHTEPKWELFELEFEALALRDPEIAARYAGHQQLVIEGLARLLAAALERGGLRFTLPPEQATRLLVSAYSAAARRHIASGRSAPLSPSDLEDVTALAYLLTERASQH
ncbi:TetR/AcrR family transcriptional regulator [Gryllotalpicola ginsengisoli]|uniref:TetR/AcrR family transcriptional regulator n=1 Tax=Gryllotalpicola ginsengisoli TaxID=444608 RepID=UPI0003B63E9D|nr:TetR/AcrR family transcriptional regulator [Gryllotalpicola ginsengisoli]